MASKACGPCPKCDGTGMLVDGQELSWECDACHIAVFQPNQPAACGHCGGTAFTRHDSDMSYCYCNTEGCETRYFSS